MRIQKFLIVLLIIWAGTTLTIFRPSDPGLPSISGSSALEGGATHTSKKREMKEEPLSYFPQELAVTLLNWKRKDSLRTIISKMQQYNDFISEILVGNNNPDMIITEKDFDSPLIPLRIYNFPQNRLFYARYELCLMATGKYCYFQDDDWENRHLRALYANFLRYPHLLHTDTNAFVHYLSWGWTFFEPSVSMHTGFSWVGTGGIASKEKVKWFTENQIPILPRESVSLADMYFSSWFNQVPYQLENELVELETKFGFSSETGGIKRNKLHISEAIRLLYKGLKENNTIFTKVEAHPTVEERYTKAPCHADDCLFMTSLHSFPNARQVIYDPRYDVEASEFLHGQLFSYKLFTDNPYHYAVDDKIETSWLSLQSVQAGDFYGLDLFQPDYYPTIYVEVAHDYQDQLSVDTSMDGETWSNQTCEWEKSSKDSSFRYSLKSNCDCKFRFVRFRALQAYSTPMQVFDVHTKDRFSKWDEPEVINNDTKPCGINKIVPVSLPDPSREAPFYLREIGNGELPVTLVLLHWRVERVPNFKIIFSHLSQYKFINEYIIWNNNLEVQVTPAGLFPNGVPDHVNLRIVNSPQNLHDFAKYMACSMATNRYCYFQDDDWLNVYLASQYTQFLRFPDIFHSITIPIINLEHRRWNIYNKEVDLHAGFSWLGVGSFIPRAKAKKFLEQLSQVNIKQHEILQADIFFSYLTNDYPWEISAIAHPLNQTGGWSVDKKIDQWAIVYSRLSISANIVLKFLQDENSKVIPRDAPDPPYHYRDVRAPCSNDKCLFLTSMASFVEPENVIFDGSKTIKQQEQEYNSLDWPSNWFWMENSYERAVDGDPFSCWTSYHLAQLGDYFGLDLLHLKVYNKLTVVIDHDISKFNLKVSPNGQSWEKVDYTVRQARMLAASIRSYSVSVDHKVPFRFIHFEAQEELANLKSHVSVYELFEGDLSGSFRSFGPNKVLNPSFETPFQQSVNESEAVDWYIQHPEGVQSNLGNWDNVENKKNVVAYTGTRSLRFTSTDGQAVSSVSQVVELYQKVPRKLIISAASKAESVVNMRYPSAGYALIVDLTLMDGTSREDAYVSVFNGGTHNWQFKTISVDCDVEIKTVTIHLFFRYHQGTVYFDDVSLQEEQW